MALLAKGVTLETLMNTFGWQRHTVRGFISILGKTHKIESTSVEGARTYKIAAKGDK
jgi:predicted transcriptional regulator